MQGNRSNSRDVWRFISDLIGAERARFHNCFDLVLLDESFIQPLESFDETIATQLRDDEKFRYETDSALGSVPHEDTPPESEADDDEDGR